MNFLVQPKERGQSRQGWSSLLGQIEAPLYRHEKILDIHTSSIGGLRSQIPD